jgi:hypothetical protein
LSAEGYKLTGERRFDVVVCGAAQRDASRWGSRSIASTSPAQLYRDPRSSQRTGPRPSVCARRVFVNGHGCRSYPTAAKVRSGGSAFGKGEADSERRRFLSDSVDESLDAEFGRVITRKKTKCSAQLRRLWMEGAPAACGHRLRDRQRHEYGRDTGCLSGRIDARAEFPAEQPFFWLVASWDRSVAPMPWPLFAPSGERVGSSPSVSSGAGAEKGCCAPRARGGFARLTTMVKIQSRRLLRPSMLGRSRSTPRHASFAASSAVTLARLENS